jgi:hypothetical protein
MAKLSRKQEGTSASGLQYRNSLRVEGHKLLSAQPVTFIRNDTVREISACIEYGQAGLDRWSIHHDVNTVHESANRIGDIRYRPFITSSKHPHKFAENRNRHGNKISFLHDLRGFPGLMDVVLNSSSDEHVCVGGDFHLAFAHS